MKLLGYIPREYEYFFTNYDRVIVTKNPEFDTEIAVYTDEPGVAARYWQPIETAPHDTDRALYLAWFNAAGELTQVGVNGKWRHYTHTFNTAQVSGWNWYTLTGFCVVPPTHWAFQDEPIPQLAAEYPMLTESKFDSVIEQMTETPRQEQPARVHTHTTREFTLKDRQFSHEGDGYIQDNNFDFDAGLRVSGDFVDDEKERYAQMIVDALNRPQEQPEAVEPVAFCNVEDVFGNDPDNVPDSILTQCGVKRGDKLYTRKFSPTATQALRMAAESLCDLSARHLKNGDIELGNGVNQAANYVCSLIPPTSEQDSAAQGASESDQRKLGFAEAVPLKHCNKCGLGKSEWSACDDPDCGELV